MSSSLAERWTVFDRIIESWRFRKVAALIPPGSVLIDIGCGNGAFLRHVSGKIGEGVGVDLKVPGDFGKVRFVRPGSEGELPLPSGSADVVTALAVLEHLEEPHRVASEIHRVLKTGGKLVLTTPSPAAKPVLEFLAFRLGIISRNDIADHKHYFSSEELSSLCSGFHSVTVTFFQLGLNTRVVAVK